MDGECLCVNEVRESLSFYAEQLSVFQLIKCCGLARPSATREDVFDLTGRTGSYFYMAPEVLHNEPYNEKAMLPSYIWNALLTNTAAACCSLLSMFVGPNICRSRSIEDILYVHTDCGPASILGEPCKWDSGVQFLLCSAQADIFSFGVLMYEVLCGTITSQIVVSPTGNARAAEVYAAKASAPTPDNAHIPCEAFF